MAGLNKYFVPRMLQFKRPTTTKLTEKLISVTVDQRAEKGKMVAKEHAFRLITKEKDGSFMLHDDDVKAIETAGFKCIPWSDRTKAVIESPEFKAKQEAEAANRAAVIDEDKRQKAAAAQRRENEKAARKEADKKALDQAKKDAKSKGKSKPAPQAGSAEDGAGKGDDKTE